uniref:Guanylate cyclase n=1 Tax=Plectus sambesii TaxID=2011161 RepID=A0A914UU88_9BILA
MLPRTIRPLLLVAFIFYKCEGRQKITVGMLMVNEDEYLQPVLGFSTTASAVTIALDRINKEHLLDDVDWEFKWYFSECSEAYTSGYTNKLIQEDKVDVILGMPCSISTIVTGALAAFYEIPVISFASTAVDFSDKQRFPTMARTVPSVFQMGRALLGLLEFFDWHQIAFLYTNDEKRQKCIYISEQLQAAKMGTSLVYNYINEIKGTVTDEAIDNFLNAVKMKARIVVACFDKDTDKRRFMLHAHDKQMTTDEYVYILPDYVPRENSETLWKDLSEDNQTDGRDVDAKKAFHTALVVEFETIAESELYSFKSEIPKRMQEPPFKCTTDCSCPEDLYGSSYSPYMHDSMYLYAKALNKTMSVAPNQIRNGTFIRENCAMTFEGISGEVVINEAGDRLPNFRFEGFNPDGFREHFGMIRTSKENGRMLELNEPYTTTSMWAERGGQRPLAVPICGFTGKQCPVSFIQANLALVAAVSVVFFILILLLIFAVVYMIYSRIQHKRLENSLWKIDNYDLVEVDSAKSLASSDQSVKTTSTTHSIPSIFRKRATKQSRYNFYYRKRELVAVCKHHTVCQFTTDDEAEFRAMRALNHENINQFHGLSKDLTGNMSVWKACTRGSLSDVFDKDTISLDWFFKFSLIRDIFEGMEYIHKSMLGVHGKLTSKSCLVNDRWQVRLSDYGLSRIRSHEKLLPKDKLWTAPELFDSNSQLKRPTPSVDIYSFAILCSEIITATDAYASFKNDDNMTDDEIVYRVVKGERPPFRPVINLPQKSDVNPTMVNLIRDCWSEKPEDRPSMRTIRNILKGMRLGKNSSLMDHVMSMMEKYAGSLEQEVAERTKALLEEQKKSDILLYRMLPRLVADKLKAGQSIPPELFEQVTIMFSDIVGFTKLASQSSPLQVVSMLNELCTLFDGVIDEHDVYKVETIGDGYLVVSGLPNRNGDVHAREIADMSLAFQRSVRTFKILHLPDETVQLRIGIHSGPVVAGVIGQTMPRYCLFGDSVNTASRMESHGKPAHIHISAEANEYLAADYLTESRGEIIIKGKGVMQTFWLRTRKSKQEEKYGCD